MSCRQKYPRRPLSVAEGKALKRLNCSHSALASRVARATARLAVLQGDSDMAAARLAG